MDIGAAIADMWHTVIVFIPKAIAFLAILVIGWLIAGFLRKWVDRLLERVGFDRAVERGGIRRWLAQGRYDASSIVAALVYYAVLLFTLQLAFGLWGPNPVSDLIEGVVAWLPRAVVAIIIIVVAAALASAVRDIVGGALAGLSYGRLLANLAGAFIVGLGVIAALNQVGIATTVTMPVLIAVLATVAGILIVGVGGGMVRPMQQRWERWLGRAEQESATIREHLTAHASARREAEAAAEAAALHAHQQAQAEAPTEIVAPATVAASARPANSSMPTQLLPKVPAQADYPPPPTPQQHPAVAPPATSDPEPPTAETPLPEPQAAETPAMPAQRPGEPAAHVRSASPEAKPAKKTRPRPEPAPTATGTAPVLPPADNRPTERTRPPAKDN